MTYSFTDTKQRTWLIEINVSAVKRVKAMTGIDLTQVYTRPEVLGELEADVLTLCNVLFAACKPQADERQVNDEQFGEGLAGDALGQACKALVEGLVSFHRNPEVRANLRRIVAAQEQVTTRAMAMTTAKLSDERIGRIVDQAVQTLERQAESRLRGLESTSGSSSTGLPAS